MSVSQQGSNGITRRGFLKETGVLAAALAASGAVVGSASNQLVPLACADEPEELPGKWVTGGCNYDCGGRCLNKVYMEDGIAIRQKTDDTHEDSADFPQQRACARGRAHRAMVFGADKLKYPLKRKNWEPHTGGNKALRGEDEWERISWDEAIAILADELKYAKEQYGNESIFWAHGSSPFPELQNVMNAFGGYIRPWNNNSFGAYKGCSKFGMVNYTTSVNDRFDFQDCEVAVMFGVNPSWSSPGNGCLYYEQMAKAGAKVYMVDPFYNDTAAAIGATWVPCRPATDASLIMGMIYTMLVEDSPQKPLIDWDFLYKYSVGFDENCMPEDAEDKSLNIKNYVLGLIDGVEKTPEWASEICGVEPDMIRELARAIAPGRNVSIITGWGNGRTSNGMPMPQLVMTLGCMTGHVGKPGHNCGSTGHRVGMNSGTFLYTMGKDGMPMVPQAIARGLNMGEIWDAILTGKAYENTTRGESPNSESNWDIHVYAAFSGNILDTITGGDKAVEAIKTVDFVVSMNNYPCASVQYSDLVLPAAGFWEGVGFISEQGTRDAVIMSTRVTEPLYEAKTPYEVAVLLSDALGLDTATLIPISEMQKYFNVIQGMKCVNDEGQNVPLITITEEDIAEWGCEGTPQEGLVPLKELKEKGVYQIDAKKHRFYAYQSFIDDPVANPLKTPSGKFELYCTTYANTINQLLWSQIEPYPTLVHGPEDYFDTFADWDAKVKGEYPLQAYTPHYLGRGHSNFANNAWVQEAFPGAVYISTKDAAEAGIADGEAVLVETAHGKMCRPAHVTARMMPGVIFTPHGNWKDRKDGIDFGGNENTISGDFVSGFGAQPFNTINARISKWDGELVPDCEKPRRVLYED